MSLHPAAIAAAEIPTPDIMVDLETMGTRPGSVICALGAVAFNPERSHVGRTFYRVIDMATAQAAGLRFDAETIKFWLKQPDAARLALCETSNSLRDVLGDFATWWKEQGGRRIWGHGGNFDDPLLASAYKAAGIKAPWDFWDSRCTRTIFAAAGGIKPDRAEGVHHNALDDAKAQVASVIEAYQILGLRKPGPTPFPFDQFDACLAAHDGGAVIGQGLELRLAERPHPAETVRWIHLGPGVALDTTDPWVAGGLGFAPTVTDDVTPRQLDALAVLERLPECGRFVPYAQQMGVALEHWAGQGVAGRDADGFFLTPSGRTLAESLLA